MEITENIASAYFIDKWISSIGCFCERDVQIFGTDIYVDFVLQNNIGIMIIPINNPISVQVVKNSIMVINKLHLNQLVLVAKSMSFMAKTTLNKTGYPIKIVHPNELSQIALLLVDSF